MTSYNVFGDISTIASRCKKQSWGLVYSIDTLKLAAEPDSLNPIYKTKSTRPNFYLGDLTKSTELNLSIKLKKEIKSKKQNV